MVEKIAPGIWRVGGGSWGLNDLDVISSGGDCNVYLLKLRDGSILVDAGTAPGQSAIEGLTPPRNPGRGRRKEIVQSMLGGLDNLDPAVRAAFSADNTVTIDPALVRTIIEGITGARSPERSATRPKSP